MIGSVPAHYPVDNVKISGILEAGPGINISTWKKSPKRLELKFRLKAKVHSKWTESQL